jgi:hypothetical protein
MRTHAPRQGLEEERAIYALPLPIKLSLSCEAFVQCGSGDRFAD